MPNKRKRDTNSEFIKRKIRKLELQLKYNRLIIYSDSEDEGSDEDRNNKEERPIDPNSIRALSPTRVSGTPAWDAEAAPAPAPAATAFPASTAAPVATSLDVPSTSQAACCLPANISDDTDPELDNEILALLGDTPKSDIKVGKPTHKELASRWQEILEKGLQKEFKDKIVEGYLIPENCNLLVPPILNPEVKVALAENLTKRDTALLAKQKQISVAISALNQAIEIAISKEQTTILKPLSDACRLMCDIHFIDTRTRRGFVVSAINPEMKETLNESKRDKFLFGENVSEKLKSAKSIKRSAADLKQTRIEPNRSHVFKKNNFIRSNRNTGNNYLNWKTMPRKITPKADVGSDRARQSQRPGTNSGFQRRETAERPSTARGWSANRRR